MEVKNSIAWIEVCVTLILIASCSSCMSLNNIEEHLTGNDPHLIQFNEVSSSSEATYSSYMAIDSNYSFLDSIEKAFTGLNQSQKNN